MSQAPQWSLVQKVCGYQFWAQSGPILPHTKAPKLGHFKAIQARKAAFGALGIWQDMSELCRKLVSAPFLA